MHGLIGKRSQKYYRSVQVNELAAAASVRAQDEMIDSDITDTCQRVSAENKLSKIIPMTNPNIKQIRGLKPFIILKL